MDAESILRDQDWLLPHLHDGTPEYQKPPLYYYLVALVGWMHNDQVDATAVRLPAVLAGLGCLILLIGLGQATGHLGTGLLGAILLGSSLHFTSLARTGRIDMPLTFTITASLVCATLADYHHGWKRTALLLAMCLSFSAGGLLKGPIGIVLPLAILLLQAQINRLVEPASARRGSLYLLWAIPLVGFLVVPWYLLVHWRTSGQFTTVFFWYHNFTRGLGGSDLRAHPWWFYGPFILYGLLPGSLLLPWSVIHGIRDSIWRDRTHRMALIWLGTVVLLLSLSRFKRADYLVPAYPAAAWLLAVSLRPLLDRLPGRTQHAFLAFYLTLLGLGWMLYTHPTGPSPTFQFADAIRRQGALSQEIVLFRCENHLLAWHLGRPQRNLIDYQELAQDLSGSEGRWIVVPRREFDGFQHELLRLLPALQCQVVLDSQGLGRPLRLVWMGLTSTSVPCLNKQSFLSYPGNR